MCGFVCGVSCDVVWCVVLCVDCVGVCVVCDVLCDVGWFASLCVFCLRVCVYVCMCVKRCVLFVVDRVLLYVLCLLCVSAVLIGVVCVCVSVC